MTISELRAALENMPPNSEVMIGYELFGYGSIDSADLFLSENSDKEVVVIGLRSDMADEVARDFNGVTYLRWWPSFQKACT